MFQCNLARCKILVLSLFVTMAAGNAAAVGLSINHTVPYVSGNGAITVPGLRVTGVAGITAADAYDVVWRFNPVTFNFDMDAASIRVYPNIGVYNGWFFVKDNTGLRAPTMIDVFTPFRIHQFDTVTTITNMRNTNSYQGNMNLMAADVASFFIAGTGISAGFTFSIRGTDVTNSYYFKSFTMPAGTRGVITGAYPIKVSGNYKITLKTKSRTPVSLTIKPHNANGKAMATLFNGSVINTSFALNQRDYYKAKVVIPANRTLTVPAPAANQKLQLLDATGKKIASTTGLPLSYRSSFIARTVYLFIYNGQGWGGTYRGTVSIR